MLTAAISLVKISLEPSHWLVAVLTVADSWAHSSQESLYSDLVDNLQQCSSLAESSVQRYLEVIHLVLVVVGGKYLS